MFSNRYSSYIYRGFLIVIFCIYFPLTKVVAARFVSIATDKTSLGPDDSLVVTASVSGFLTGERIYIKGAWFKDGSSNYFGYTQSDANWIKNSAKTSDQRQVDISIWNGQAVIKPDTADTGFSGSGEYKLKLGYYYPKDDGEYSSVQWSENTLTLQLTAPTPTHTSAPTPTKSPTPSHTLVPTQTGVPTPSSTKKPIHSPTISSTIQPTSTTTDTIQITQSDTVDPQPEVLGASDAAGVSRFASLRVLIVTLVSVGGGLALLAGALVWRKHLQLSKHEV